MILCSPFLHLAAPSCLWANDLISALAQSHQLNAYTIQFCPGSVIRFGWCWQSTLRSLIGDILHSMLTFRLLQAGHRQGCCWGMNQQGFSRSSPSSLQQIQPWPSVKPLIARSPNLVIFSIYPTHPIPKFPPWWCWPWAAGGDPGLQLLPRH